MKNLLLILSFLPLLARAQTIIKIAPCEYVVYFMGDDSVLYTVGGAAHSLPGGRKVLDLAGAFNKAAIAANDGTFWNSTDYTQTYAVSQVTTDTLGNMVNDVDGVWAYADAVFIRRKTDSSIWAVNNDSIGLFHALGSRYIITKPIKLTQSGVKYKKMVPCGDGLYGHTNDGKVYYWPRNSQSTTPILIWAGSPKCLDIASATFNAVIAIIQNATGDPTCGRPYAKGNSWGDWGGTSITYSSFTDISSILQMPYSVKKVCMSTNSLHFIDSLGQQFGVAKVGSNGELGHGENYVNKFTYPTFPGFGWNSNIENPIPGPAKQVNPGVKHKELFAAGFFGLYCMSLDSTNNIDMCGRNKSLALDGSVQNPTDNGNHPNALDIYTWKRITPMTTIIKTLRFVAPSFAVVGGNQTISVSSTSVTTAGNAMCLINQANSTDTVRGKASSNTHKWVQTSGPVGSTIVSSTSATTSITGLVTGTYIFKDTITDGFQGTNLAAVTINATVSGTIPPTVSAGSDQVITLPVSSSTLTGTATGNGGATITSTAWTFVSGPATPAITSPSSLTTNITGMTVPGIYVYKLTANDSNSNSSFDNVQVTVLQPAGDRPCRKCRIIVQ